MVDFVSDKNSVALHACLEPVNSLSRGKSEIKRKKVTYTFFSFNFSPFLTNTFTGKIFHQPFKTATEHSPCNLAQMASWTIKISHDLDSGLDRFMEQRGTEQDEGRVSTQLSVGCLVPRRLSSCQGAQKGCVRRMWFPGAR